LGRAALLEDRWHVRTGRAPDEAWDEALRHFQAALQRNPNDAATYRLIAEVYHRMAESASASGRDSTATRRQAETALEQALRLCPDDPEARTLRAALEKAAVRQ
jgi:tetratricopeptide (TPR) repeat protein